MRRFRIVIRNVRLVVLCVAAILPAYASRLNPVSWSLTAGQQPVAPGSTVTLKLHAQIDQGYHLYSFSTPRGGPIRTTASVQGSPDIQGFRVYQPKPDRHQDPNLNVPVETFTSGVEFLLPAILAKGASTGDQILKVNIRYQACSDVICLPPAMKMIATSVAVQRGAAAAKVSLPGGYQLVGQSDPKPQRPLQPSPVNAHLLLAFGFGLAALFTP